MDGKGSKPRNTRVNTPAVTAIGAEHPRGIRSRITHRDGSEGLNKKTAGDPKDISVLKGATSADTKAPENQLFHILSTVAESLMEEGPAAGTKVEDTGAGDAAPLKDGDGSSGDPMIEDIVQISGTVEPPISVPPVATEIPVTSLEHEAIKQIKEEIPSPIVDVKHTPLTEAANIAPGLVTQVTSEDTTQVMGASSEPRENVIEMAGVLSEASPLHVPVDESVPVVETVAASPTVPSIIPSTEATREGDGSPLEVQTETKTIVEEVPAVQPHDPPQTMVGNDTEVVLEPGVIHSESISNPEVVTHTAEELPPGAPVGVASVEMIATEVPSIVGDLGADEAGQSFVEAMQEAIQPQGVLEEGMARVADPVMGEADVLPQGLGDPSLGGPGFKIPVDNATSPGGNADEEEEDIDILDVDEEEEAAVKQAMGVGRVSAEGYPDDSLRGAEGEFVANGVGIMEGDLGLGEPHVDGMGGDPMLSGGEEPAKAMLQHHKRKMGEEHHPGMVPELDAVNRRTRQRTARPPPQKKKRQQGLEDDDTEAEPSLSIDLDQLQAEALVAEGGEPPAAAAKLRRAKMASVSNVSPTGSPTMKAAKKKLDEANAVRFSIKQFTVPELTVAMPDTASISAVKKAAMDATMNLLGGGLKMRVLLQGKRMQDEDATLAQAGISKAALGNRASDALTFMLEPLPLGQFPPENDTDPLLVLSQPMDFTTPRWPSYGASSTGRGRARTRPSYPYPGVDSMGGGYYGDTSKGRLRGKGPLSPPAGGAGRGVPSPHTTRVAAAQALAAIRAQAEANQRNIKMEGEGGLGEEPLNAGSGAIILHPSVHGMPGEGSMAMVPHYKRSGSMAIVSTENRRRIRRPFTVSEVAALVEAVEQLGTGRCAAALTSAWWRDVKLRAFSQAKHRTYVDLKDKWKTLVHTAQIAPHQRRGEPVPQELLDRVVRAHAYWTEQLRQEQLERES